MNENEYKSALGKLIKHQRVKKQLSQEDYAAHVNLHRTYVGAIERGEKNLSFDNILKIAQSFDMTLSQLFKKAEQLGPKPDGVNGLKAGRKPRGN